MTNIIAGIERQIVLRSLYSKSTQIIINSESEKKPVLFTPSEYSVPGNDIIFFQKNVAVAKSQTLAKIIQSDVNQAEFEEFTICFFYQGIALFFKCVPKKTENGIAFLIPQHLFKKEDERISANQNISASIFYTSNKRNGNFLTCYCDNNFEIFSPKVWLSFPKALFEKALPILQSTARIEYNKDFDSLLKHYPKQKKLLYLPEGKVADRNYFSYDASFSTDDYLDADFVNEALIKDKEVFIPMAESANAEPYAICSVVQESVVLSPLDIADSLNLMVACKFLAEDSRIDKDLNVAQNSPLKLLYISESILILGSEFGNFPLQRGYEYPASVNVELQIGKRELFFMIFVSRLYQNSNGKSCALCRISSISEEDRRFLYENLYKKKYQ